MLISIARFRIDSSFVPFVTPYFDAFSKDGAVVCFYFALYMKDAILIFKFINAFYTFSILSVVIHYVNLRSAIQ